MIIQGTNTVYPYLRGDKTIALLGFYDEGTDFGQCLVSSDEEGVEVSFSADFKDLHDTNKAIIKRFDTQIAAERTKSENIVVQLQEAKQKFLAIGVES